MSDFYHVLTEAKTKEQNWLKNLYPESDSLEITRNLIAKICEFIQAEVADILMNEISSCDDDIESLELLIKVSRKVNNFVKDMEFKPSDPLLVPILQPYSVHLYSFGKMITQKLFIQLNDIQLDGENFAESLNKLQNSIDKVFTLFWDCFDVCDDLTGGLGYEQTLAAANKFLSKYAMKINLFLKTLRKGWKISNEEQIEFISESDTWRSFSDSVQILGVIGNLINTVDKTNEQISAKILETAGNWFSSDGFVSVLSEPHRFNYLKSSDMQKFQDLCTQNLASIQEKDPENQPLASSKRDFLKLNQQAVDLAYSVIVAQVKLQFATVSTNPIWSDEKATESVVSDLPEMGFSPLEYVTSIGEFVLTLPQHLEPFSEISELTAENFNSSDYAGLFVSMSNCTLQNVSPEDGVLSGSEWLESLVKSMEAVLVKNFKKISILTDSASLQLKADVDYICNVTDSLGIEPLPSLLDMKKLATIDRKVFIEELDGEMDKSLVSVVAKMRGIDLNR